MSVSAVCKARWWWMLAGIWYGILFLAGVMPQVQSVSVVEHSDKLIHWAAYAFFGALLFLNRRLPMWYLLPALTLSAIQEATHLIVETRKFEWLDVLANGVGIVSGWIFVRCLWNYFIIDQEQQA